MMFGYVNVGNTFHSRVVYDLCSHATMNPRAYAQQRRICRTWWGVEQLEKRP
jgi:hypothetical protein